MPKKIAMALAAIVAIFPIGVLAETVWSNDHWIVDKRNAQIDEDD